MKFSVIVAFNNRYELMTHFLESLAKNVDFSDGELVLISDQCKDIHALRYVGQMALKHPWINFISLDQATGYAKANNIAVQHSHGNILVFINSDVFPESGAINALVEYTIEKNVGAAQGKLIFPQNGQVQSTGHLFWRYRNAHVYTNCRKEEPLVCQSGLRQALTSAFTAIPRKVFDSVGGFDEIYYNAYEGMELTLKITLSGGTCVYYADAEASHAVGGSRSNMKFDDNTPAHIFWHRWGDQIKDDLPSYIMPQITADMEREIYYLMNGSSLLDWGKVLKELKLRTAGSYDLPSRFCSSINLYYDLPHMALDAPQPYLFVVDSLSALKGNRNWAEHRQSPKDLVLDGHGVLSPLRVLVGLPPV